MKDRTENCGEIGGRTLADVVAAAKAEILRARCESAAFLAIVAERDLAELARELQRHAADAGLDNWLGEHEVELIITESIEAARRELAKAAE
jgi:hypothetical protein